MKIVLTYICLSLYVFSFGQSSPYSDYQSAYLVCDKKPILFKTSAGAGSYAQEISEASCFSESFAESNSTWVKFEIEKPGWLGFEILPQKNNSDLDFVLFKSDDIWTSRTVWNNEIRCMASGERIGDYRSKSNQCFGATGLRRYSEDQSEKYGCSTEDDNFLSSVYVEPGESYVLFINNYSGQDGFTLEFYGDFEFSLPELSLQVSEVSSNEQDVEYLVDFGASIKNHFSKYILNYKSNDTEHLLDLPAKIVLKRGHVGYIDGIVTTTSGCALAVENEISTLSTSIEQNNVHVGEFTPNPTSDFATLEILGHGDRVIQLTVTDQNGKAVPIRYDINRIQLRTSIEFNASSLSDGLYHCTIRLDDNEYLRKFVKHNR